MNQNLQQHQNYRSNSYSLPENAEGGLNIDEFKNILLRKLPLIGSFTLLFTVLGLLRILMAPPVYTARFELLSEPVNIETKVTSSNEDSRKTREEISDVDLDEVQLKILKSPRLVLRIVETLKDRYPDLSYGDLISDLNIEIISSSQKDQNILLVIYENPDKQKVADVIDALVQTYQSYSVEKRQSGVRRGIAFLDKQIPKISTQAKKISSQITELRTKYNFNTPDNSLEQITMRMSQIDIKRENNSKQLRELQGTLSTLDRELAIRPANLNSITSFVTPGYTELLKQLQILDVEISQQSTIFSDQSHTIQALLQEKQQLILLIAEAGKDIRQKLVNQIVLLENRQQALKIEKENLKSQLRQWSEISGEYSNLEHRLNIANRKLNEFTLQKDALQIDAAQKESPWQLLTPAGEPVSNNINTINYLLMTSTLGLLFGVGFACILDKQQNIIYNSAKIEEITDLPILTGIPYNPKQKQLPFLKPISIRKDFKQSSMALDSLLNIKQESSMTFSIETFRSFAANLGLLNFNNTSEILSVNANIRSIAITSAIPREGKSTIALNLAKATASMGKKVLIVDTDLHSTKHLSSNLGYEEAMGLRNILEQNISHSGLHLIQKLPLEDNLFILPSGLNNLIGETIKDDPSRLLASTKMYSLMEELKKQFDLVIYDFCSIIGFADVNLLSTKTDGIVLVTGLGKIQSAAFTEALEQLKRCNAPVIGVALNKLVN